MATEHQPLSEGQIDYRNRTLAKAHDLFPQEYKDWLLRFLAVHVPELLPVAAGREIDCVTFTSNVTVTATTDATADVVVTADARDFTGEPVLVEFYCMEAQPPDFDAGALIFNLYEDGSDVGRIWATRTVAAENGGGGVRAVTRRSPSKGSHTYSVRCWKSGLGNGLVVAGAGGAGTAMPGFIRISRTA